MRSQIMFGAVGAVALLVPAQSWAEEAGDSSGKSSGTDEIVITALHRETSLQETPISVAVLSSDLLAKTDAASIQDIFRRVPNVNITTPAGGRARVSVRGIQVAGEPTVGLYYDETFVSGGSGTTQDSGMMLADLGLFDVERVEVLRGPQGTLYGASAMTGALKVIFRKPDAGRLEGAVDVGYQVTEEGSDGWRLRGMLNVPLVRDVLALRVVGSRQITPGYLDATTFGREDTGSSKSTSIRTQLGWTPDSDLSVTGTFTYQRQTLDNAQGWYESLGPYKNNSNALLPFESSMRLYSLTADWDAGPVRVTGNVSHYDWNTTSNANLSNVVRALGNNPVLCQRYFALPGACSPDQVSAFQAAGVAELPVIVVAPDRLKNTSVELRAASTGDGPINWTLGAFYQDRYDRVESNFARGSTQTGLAIQPLSNLAKRFIGTKLEQKAGFLEIGYRPVDALTLTGGLRRYEYNKFTEGQVLQSSLLVGVVPAAYAKVRADAKGWLSHFNIEYKASSDVMLYANAGQGMRPGGANNVPGLSTTLVAYAPDKLWTYEVGGKTSWLAGRLTINAALFQIDWTDLQVSAQASSGPFAFITNAGAARIQGGELEIVARPLSGLELNFGLGYANGKLTKDQASSDIVVTGSSGLKGDRLPNVPRATINAGAEYRWAVGGGKSAYLRGDAFYRSRMHSTYRPDTDPYFETYGDDLTLTARAGLEIDRLTVSAYVENLTNRKALTNLSSSLFSIGEAYSVQPRTYGLSLGITF